MFDKIADLVAKELVEVPPIIEDLGLEEWYKELSKTERRKLRKYKTAMGPNGKEISMLDFPRAPEGQTKRGFVGSAGKAISAGDYEFAEKRMLEGLAMEGTLTDKHFIYNDLIDLYYKQRNDRDDAIDLCIKYCKKDIEIAGRFLGVQKRKYGSDTDLPRMPAFKRLAIIYENQEKYEKAIEICEKALDKGLDDNTKGGFEGRKDRLEKKLANSSN